MYTAQRYDPKNNSEPPPLYVYDQVRTKGEMQHRMERAPLDTGTGRKNLSGAYKKQAHIHAQAEGYLRDFYSSSKRMAKKPRHMGVIEDASARRRPQQASPQKEAPARQQTPKAPPQKRPASDAFSQTRSFHAARPQTAHAQPKAAWRGGAETVVFHSPAAQGGAAAKTRRGPLEGLFDFFDAVDTRLGWQRDVDAARKQAVRHKKWQEHRHGLTLAGSILLIFAVCCIGIYQLLFVVRDVEVTGSLLYDTQEIVAATGLHDEMHLYDFTADEITDRITFYCPYIRSATLTRSMPTTVHLALEDDEIRYCANIFDEIVALSPSLRVLGTLTAEEAADYILLRLPGVSEAVAGRGVVFTDTRHERYVRQVLDDITESTFADRISYIDLRDEHDLILYCDGLYALQLGNTADIPIKLRMADKALADALFPQNTPARVDLHVVGYASVMADLRLDLTVTP